MTAATSALPTFQQEIKIEILGSLPRMRCCSEVFLAALALEKSGGLEFVLPSGVFEPALKLVESSLPEWAKPEKIGGRLFCKTESAPRLVKLLGDRLDLNDRNSLRKHCAKTFLKGAFLRTGYIQNPQENYHIDILLPGERHSAFFKLCSDALKVPFCFCRKGPSELAYLKSKMGIRRFLSVLELYDRVLAFDDLSATRNLLGEVNRQVNFETANIKKSVSASEKMVQDIKRLMEYHDRNASSGEPTSHRDRNDFDRTSHGVIWSTALRDLALKRVEFPLDSLEALGRRCVPPLSKSAVNHRLRRISDLHLKIFGDTIMTSEIEGKPTKTPNTS